MDCSVDSALPPSTLPCAPLPFPLKDFKEERVSRVLTKVTPLPWKFSDHNSLQVSESPLNILGTKIICRASWIIWCTGSAKAPQPTADMSSEGCSCLRDTADCGEGQGGHILSPQCASILCVLGKGRSPFLLPLSPFCILVDGIKGKAALQGGKKDGWLPWTQLTNISVFSFKSCWMTQQGESIEWTVPLK